MTKKLLTYIIFCWLPCISSSQVNVYINDRIEHNNMFSLEDSRMLDTTSLLFDKAKCNVLHYCSKNLGFDIDSTAILYSCREYKNINPNATKKERRLVDRKKLRYQFFIDFKINENIIYYTSYYLDSMMQVHYESEWLFNGGASKVWDIATWESISEKISNYDDSYILPIEEIDIEYSDKYKAYVYIILQKKTEETPVEIISTYIETWQVNKLIVAAEDGEVLEKTKEGFRSMSMPSW